MQFAASDRASRINDAVFRHHSDAVISINGAADFGGIFEEDYVSASVGMVGMASSAPMVQVPSCQVPHAPVGLPLSVNGKYYHIAAVEPDGSGSTRLILEQL